MNLSFAARLLAASLALAQAQSRVPAVAATPSQLAAGTDHWCGPWAGAPNPSNIPFGQQLPPNDFVRHFFVEPQLQKVPFSPVLAKEPKVQIPKIWGNNDFRIALLSYATAEPTTRIYSSSKSRWADFHEALGKLMSECVSKGSGGAWLVPPSPGLTQGTLVVYAYEVGSQFDFQLNYEMSVPQGIDPARLGQTSSQSLSAASVPASAAIDDAEVIAVPSSAAPALAARPPVGYSYVGCFNEIPGRAFTSANKTGSTMTAHECSSFCSSEQYFGTEFGTECYCGDKISIGSTQVSDGCDTPCMGDKTQVCGGVQHLTVYRKETQTA